MAIQLQIKSIVLSDIQQSQIHQVLILRILYPQKILEPDI